MKSLYSLIPAILERFNFENVHRTMELLNWHWAGLGIPTVEQLRFEATRHLETCVSEFEKAGCPKSGMLVASGGFQAMIHCFGRGEPELQLIFYVDSASERHWN
jgi:hypothetical protein